ncbi:MAG: class I SAM-dependent methyltransferase [bacterium]
MEHLDLCDICGSGRLAAVDPPNRICRCLDCGYIFDNPRPTIAEIGAFYSRPGKYDGWLREEQPRFELWRRRLAIVRRFVPTGKLLDVGTGTGQFLSVASSVYEVDGTEVSSSAVAVARERYGLEVRQGTLEAVDFASQFDLVTLFHVLEHVPSPSLTIRRCRQLLRSGGLLVIAVPNDVVSVRSLAKRALGILRAGGWRRTRYGLPAIRLDGSQSEVHLSHFTPKVLRMLLARNGFGVVSQALDPYYVAVGRKKLAQDAWYTLHLGLHRLTGLNFYDTSLTVARAQ